MGISERGSCDYFEDLIGRILSETEEQRLVCYYLHDVFRRLCSCISRPMGVAMTVGGLDFVRLSYISIAIATV